MDSRVRHKGNGKHWLSGSEPEEAHDHNCRVVVHVEEGQPLDWFSEYDEDCVSELEYLREIEDLCPEEKRSAGFRIDRETDRVEQTCCRICGDRESATNSHD